MTEFKSETRGHYGLHWKDHPEAVVKRCKAEIPILKIISSSNIWAVDTVNQINIFDNHYTRPNMLIKGENYHALTVLEFTHKGKIDCVYVDSPYNTGNKDFIYNDKFVDKEDGDRHSKWLSFMNNRVQPIRKLLSDTGVVFFSIDDHEYAQLKLLCDKIFGEENVEVMIWNKVGSGQAGAGKMKQIHRFRRDHEYIIVCYKNKNLVNFCKVKEKPNFKNTYTNPDNDPRGPYKAGNMSKTEEKSIPKGKNYYTVASPSEKRFTRQWHYPKEEFEKLNKDKRIYWGKNGDAVPAIKIFINEPREIFPSSILLDKGALTSAKSELESVIGKSTFDTPKPLALIKFLLNLINNKNAIILDFFAGSGTTGHAVLEMNKEDDGNRQFILCTNDEGNIFTDICYPRLKNVIEGYKTPKGKVVEGIPANLVCFTCGQSKTGSSAFMKITKDADPDTLKLEMAQHSTGIIKTIEGTYIEESTSYVKGLGDVEYVLLRNGGKKEPGNKYVGVYCTIYGDKLNELRVKMNAIKGKGVEKILYYLTLEEEIPSSMLKSWDNVEIKPFPREFFNRFINS